uniref:Uncharacterized protein n=1 Tax=Solanum tuberosum TaxID=4113 RepID=M1DYX7_SOLTU
MCCERPFSFCAAADPLTSLVGIGDSPFGVVHRRLAPSFSIVVLWVIGRYADHSASLVGIADQLGDSPVGVLHRCVAPSFSIVVLWVIGRQSTASRNFSVIRRLLLFFANLILSLRDQHTGTKGEVRPFGD